jgi:hypothetical protein
LVDGNPWRKAPALSSTFGEPELLSLSTGFPHDAHVDGAGEDLTRSGEAIRIPTATASSSAAAFELQFGARASAVGELGIELCSSFILECVYGYSAPQQCAGSLPARLMALTFEV